MVKGQAMLGRVTGIPVMTPTQYVRLLLRSCTSIPVMTTQTQELSFIGAAAQVYLS